MSWQSLADVFAYVQQPTLTLTSTEKFVLLALANFADAHGANAYPSQQTLMTLTSLSERAVRRAIAALKRQGLLTTTLQRGRYGAQHYTLHLPAARAKGATQAPYPSPKGATQAALKGPHRPPDPVPKIQIPLPSSFLPFSPPTISQEEMERHLRFLGVSPGSTIYQAALHPYEHNGH